MSFVLLYTLLWTYNTLFYGVGIIQSIRAKKSTFGKKNGGSKTIKLRLQHGKNEVVVPELLKEEIQNSKVEVVA